MQIFVRDLNRILLQSIDKISSIGLSQGLMGISIYFYHLSRNDKTYKPIADRILDTVFERIPLSTSISVKDGLIGIAFGIIHLIDEGFVEGNINDVLSDIDDVIFRKIAFCSDFSIYEKEEILCFVYYLSLRMSYQEKDDDKYIYEELIIGIINAFYTDLDDDFFNESYSFSIHNFHLPLFTYVCAYLLRENIYSEKVYKILEEYEVKILSRFPVLHANRLYMLCGICPLIPYVKKAEWISHARLLHDNIDIQVILNDEMCNKRIFVDNGLSFIYILLNYLRNNHREYGLCYKSQIFYNKILSSEAWSSLYNYNYFFEAHQGILGFNGVILTLLYIQNMIKYEI